MKEQRFDELFRRYMQQGLTDAEETELFQLWLDPLLKSRIAQTLDEFYDELPRDKDMPAEDADFIFKQIVQKEAPVRRLPVSAGISTRRRLAVAAAVSFIIGLSGYFLLFNKKQPVSQEIVKASHAGDVEAPETNRAMILLANGQKVYLDSAANGSLTMLGSIQLVKLADGKIAYEATGTSSGEVSYNTLLNPRGSKIIDITLADGSRVWLNAGSSLTYPVAFTGNERKVSIEGEAYFEVAHNASKPFIVSKENTDIKVLGTRFNVNAYDDEADMKITLLQGAIRVTNNQQAAIVKPGEQAIVKSGRIDMADAVNLEQVMSWKEGYFRMKGTDLASLMRQIARWYDVQVVYKNKVPEGRFGGLINREVNLLDVLNALEQYGIYSRFENGKIIVL
ncbi:iron dicitrate transport regulator FecR [Terrimonas sp.]|uniref:FecR domain-containing protein n=1 Tax=Terrimonas sp. TaxID=1914338 RepID=UPI000D523DD6|nr:FecR domain-containing protein [Terrimonas sp.]PVD52563.1 iron dicitrate transport regulator FecR [Terrimonas sp.]